ncbi:GntR family transcriptional regulator [Bacillus haikouensis]|jgi:GntR family transcriptional regulator|uniref:GntR family transcriptional regulator n=1 Tax=Bacillus haikouensis TaxID=1510468 RepID=UPI0015543061|nr:GntR family transcriptional regulator [Bacillus haikouensis]NQD64333.1 GntR family transcriptional regulator [Bacillus haikouensis]
MPHPSINHKKSESLYLQVKNVLMDRIESNQWKPNTLIPTEQELIDEFEVSRTTIRQAVNLLVQMDLLEKKQGHGTVVKNQKLMGSLGRLKGFAEEVLEKGKTPRSKLIRQEIRDDLFHEKAALGISENDSLVLIERIRFADDIPIALERSCWPLAIGKNLIKHNLNQAKFYEILEDEGVYLHKAKEIIKAINATIDEADLLGIRPGESLLEMNRISYSISDRPVEYTKTKYRSDQYYYDIDLTR